ncbi:hypothetical protein QMA09_12155 [Planococcus sp. APC 3906]|uniref:hypothetical protein n=1 Tax=Planococcus sp. APC 3906 TaxID=3035194 RepID=UPI0025B4FE3D|nr:hypothetical protein [Planococcus sp. APC 3906]MDN3450941.1 hypothetical protein [Planococcus sp. APC 3906]
MSGNIYSIELLHQGKYDSWEFSSDSERDQFYERVKKHFAGKELNEEAATDDAQIVQLSATSLEMDKAGVEQKIPYVWYEGDLFEEMLGFINGQYAEKENGK